MYGFIEVEYLMKNKVTEKGLKKILYNTNNGLRVIITIIK